MSNFNKLPNGVKQIIFSKLYKDFTNKELLNYQLVSKDWHKTFTDLKFNKRIYTEDKLKTKEDHSQLFQRIIINSIKNENMDLVDYTSHFHYVKKYINYLVQQNEIANEIYSKCMRVFQELPSIDKDKIEKKISFLESLKKTLEERNALIEKVLNELEYLEEPVPLPYIFLCKIIDLNNFAEDRASLLLEFSINYLKSKKENPKLEFSEHIEDNLSKEDVQKFLDFIKDIVELGLMYDIVLSEALKELNAEDNNWLEDNIQILNYFGLPKLLVHDFSKYLDMQKIIKDDNSTSDVVLRVIDNNAQFVEAIRSLSSLTTFGVDELSSFIKYRNRLSLQSVITLKGIQWNDENMEETYENRKNYYEAKINVFNSHLERLKILFNGQHVSQSNTSSISAEDPNEADISIKSDRRPGKF